MEGEGSFKQNGEVLFVLPSGKKRVETLSSSSNSCRAFSMHAPFRKSAFNSRKKEKRRSFFKGFKGCTSLGGPLEKRPFSYSHLLTVRERETNIRYDGRELLRGGRKI